MFDSISTLAVASNMRELYRLVLVDTPLAPYFSESLTAGALSPQMELHSLAQSCKCERLWHVHCTRGHLLHDWLQLDLNS